MPATFWQQFLEGFSDPMIKILLVIAAISLVRGIDALKAGAFFQNNQIDYNWVAIDGNVPSLIIK